MKVKISELSQSWAVKMKLATCQCDHPNTIHAGGIGDCAMTGCTCGEFKEKLPSTGKASAFQKVKETMSKPIV